MTPPSQNFDKNGNRICSCGSKKPTYWLHDGYNIPLCMACEDCERAKRKRYRSDIMTAYQSDEPIDSE